MKEATAFPIAPTPELDEHWSTALVKGPSGLSYERPVCWMLPVSPGERGSKVNDLASAILVGLIAYTTVV